MPVTVRIASDSETLQADLYGDLPAKRVAILVHGSEWDGSGWREIAPRFVARGLPVLALNLRGYDGSTGRTNTWSEGVWSPVIDLRSAKAMLRERGARELALVGASMGGHAVLASSFDADVECVVSISAPVQGTADDLVRKITGRKLFVCASGDTLGAAPHVLRAFEEAGTPKTLLMFGGKEHSRGMFAAPYGDEAIDAIVDFAAKGLPDASGRAGAR